MRSLLSGVLLLMAMMSTASAEVWRTREGQCGEWRARWTVEQDQDGLWRGTVDRVHVGGSCETGTGERTRASVQAVIVGETFFAARRGEDRTVCSYYARLQEDRVRGVQLCEGEPERMVFALRFPPKDDLQVQRRPDDRQDEWLDDPQTLDRTRPPAGFSLEFQLGPRR